VDFVVDTATIPYEKLYNRYMKVGWQIFCKTRGGVVPGTGLTMPEFGGRMQNLRIVLNKMVRPRIEAEFVKRFELHFPDFTYGGGKKVKNCGNFCTAISLATCDDELLEMVDTVMHVMWGPSNNWATAIEVRIMQLVGLEYDPERYIDLPDGKQKKDRVHQGGSCRRIVVERKNREVNQRVKREMIKSHHCVPFRRNVGTGKLIVKVVRAKTFGGYIGMTDKHPVVIAELKIAEQKKSTTATDTTGTTVTNTIGKKKQTDVPLWLEELLSNNTNTTPEELLALMKQKVDGTPPFPTEATTSETETCLSPITDTSGNDNVSTDKFISGNC
jgi:hypothetical protein